MIYYDNAATTALSDRALEAMLPYLKENYGNCGGMYRLGVQSKKAVSRARKQISEALHCEPEEIYFTSGGTEADNWAMIGMAEQLAVKGKHLITTQIEHHAVLHACNYLETKGFEVTYLPVSEDGRVSVETVEKAIRPDTVLISVMYANNEIGSIQPIKEIGEIARKHQICFHTDAVQAVGHLNIHVKDEQIDMLSASGHKFGAAKGIGFLYCRKEVGLEPLLFGGNQERGKRAGTENVAAIVSMGEALEEALEYREEKNEKQKQIRDYLYRRTVDEISGCSINGTLEQRMPGNLNISVKDIESETLIFSLDMQGVCVSGGSACTSGNGQPSHVLTAIGKTPEESRRSIRISLGEKNTMEEAETAFSIIKETIEQLRWLRKV